jgi:hypothetical protein
VAIRKLEVYVETSVWNFLRAKDVPRRREITERFFANAEMYDLFISPFTIAEIEDAPADIRDELLGFIQRYQPNLIDEEEEINDLADEYVDRGIFPVKYAGDALHVAYASFYANDILLSWNFRHIVKYKVRIEVRAANIILGYRTPEILSPEEIDVERQLRESD